MNWRYIVGKSLSNIGDTIIRSKFMPLTRVIPVGMSSPYDIKRFSHKNPVEVIFDVGANIGQTSLFLNRHFPQADIFAFEPIQQTYEILKFNSIKTDKIKPFHYALGAKKSQKTIRIRDNSELNTLVDSSNRAIAESEIIETVKITTLDDFGRSNQISQIDILKMDVQGYELEVLFGGEYYLSNNLINFVYSEVDFDKSNKECQNFEDIYIYLEKFNFAFSGFYECFRWGDNKRFFKFCNALFVNRNL